MAEKEYVKNNKAFGVLGELKQQASFAFSVRTSIEKLFSQSVTDISIVTEPVFLIYDKYAKDVEVIFDGNLIVLSPIEQGAIAMLRASSTRKLTQISDPIIEHADTIFSKSFYEQFFIKYDWRFAPIYKDFAAARVAARK